MDTKGLIFRNPEKMEKKEILEVIRTGDTAEICNALVATAFHEEDLEFCLKVIVEALENPDDWVKSIAILCIGHLARIHQELPKDIVIPIILDALKSKIDDIKGHAENAMDDIEIFMPALWREINKMKRTK